MVIITSLFQAWILGRQRSTCRKLFYYNLRGYLATITAADEAKISGEQAEGAGWIMEVMKWTEGVWKWVTGPDGLRMVEQGTLNGLATGSTTPPYFCLVE
jgi:hypothetical protein